MKLLIIALAFAATSASASTTCYYIGTTLFCNDSNGNQTSCYMIGNTMFCN